MSRFVRQSKYRHVFGTASKPENCYQDIKMSRSAWDSNFIDVNPKYIAVCWHAGGGGAVAVLNHSQTGKVKPDHPIISGHTGTVLDVAWSPFNDQILATSSEDCTVKLWQIPEEGVTERMEESVVTLKGHQKKVGGLMWHPLANNVLATSSPDATVRLWDVEKAEMKQTLSGMTDMVLSTDWNYDGTQITTICKDKKIRSFDARSGELAFDVKGHDGIKGARLVWTGDMDRLVTVGFSRQSDRQMFIWDPKNMEKPIKSVNIDTSSGILMPFWDNDSKMLYLAGKGDGNIRYFEFVNEEPYHHFVSQHQSSVSQRGMAAMPKRAVDVSNNEMMKLFKLSQNTIEPISFRVPRKSDMFQEDLYPDCASDEPALSADEWFGGANAEPKKMSLRDGFDPSARTQKAFSASDAAKNTNKKEKEMTLVEAKAKIKELEKALADAQVKLRTYEAKA